MQGADVRGDGRGWSGSGRESGGSGSIGVGGRVKGLGMDEWDGVHGNQLLLG